jgi:uncharacterized integral membrane protein
MIYLGIIIVLCFLLLIVSEAVRSGTFIYFPGQAREKPNTFQKVILAVLVIALIILFTRVAMFV